MILFENNYSLLYFFVCTVNLTTVDLNKFENFQFESVSFPTTFITTMCDEGKTYIQKVIKKNYIFLFVQFKKIDFPERGA